MSRALVTGATGFVGRALTRRLLAGGWSVAALVRRADAELPPGVEALRVPDTDADLVELVAATAPTHCFHLATEFRGVHQVADIAPMIAANLHFGTVLAEGAGTRSGAGVREHRHRLAALRRRAVQPGLAVRRDQAGVLGPARLLRRGRGARGAHHRADGHLRARRHPGQAHPLPAPRRHRGHPGGDDRRHAADRPGPRGGRGRCAPRDRRRAGGCDLRRPWRRCDHPARAGRPIPGRDRARPRRAVGRPPGAPTRDAPALDDGRPATGLEPRRDRSTPGCAALVG